MVRFGGVPADMCGIRNGVRLVCCIGIDEIFTDLLTTSIISITRLILFSFYFHYFHIDNLY